MKTYYLASGFFNEKQIRVVEKFESLAEGGKVDILSPRKFSADKGFDMKVEDPVIRDIYCKEIFDENVKNINFSDVLLCNLSEPYDIGTVWEVGYFCASKYCRSYSTSITVIDGNDSDLMRWLIKLPELLNSMEDTHHPRVYYITDFDSAIEALKDVGTEGNKYVICIDDRQFDCIFAIGVLYALVPVDQIYTYSVQNYGSNVMIAESIANHYLHRPEKSELTISINKNQKIGKID